MSARVIFLDMDGVLSSPRAYLVQEGKPDPDCWIDPVAVLMLNHLCEQTGALIVVSSTWRKGNTRESFSDLLARNGFTGALHEDWRTIDSRDGRRGPEVKEWLSRHAEVTAHVILDDESDFDDDQPLVQTSGENGFRFEDFFAAFTAFGQEWKHPKEFRASAPLSTEAGR